MRRHARTILAATAMTVALIGRSDGDPGEVAFPQDFKTKILYNVVDREDQKEVHEQYTSRGAIAAAQAGKPLPYGTVVVSANYKAQLDASGHPVRDARGNMIAGRLDRLAVMEKRPRGGSEYPEDLRNGEWEFALFTPDGKTNSQVPVKMCMACHKPHEQLDYIKTYFPMAGKRVETTPTPIPTGAAVVSVLRLGVSPARITVRAGVPVAWVNADEAAHQFLVEGVNAKTNYFLKGSSGTVVIDRPGTYSYRDTFYPNLDSLAGTIEVTK